MTFDDLRWLERKRMEIVRLAGKIDQRGHDGPRYLRIIDELMVMQKSNSVGEMIRELGVTWDE